MENNSHGPLGEAVSYPEQYRPEILHPIPRSSGREALAIRGELPFVGVDIWNAYELSWLNQKGKPQVACAEFRFPASSSHIVESKSFKLYLNSFNQHKLTDAGALQRLLVKDLSAACGASVDVRLYIPDSWDGDLPLRQLQGVSLDQLDIVVDSYSPDASLLALESESVATQHYFSDLLRSRCPVTGQPDWASVAIELHGPRLEKESLLRYLISFRQKNDFHEQCVEQIFCDIARLVGACELTVYARYLRRGGLDINPWRSNCRLLGEAENTRLLRQ